MLSTLVLTLIGADGPGLVRTIAATIADHGGNWLESRMCRLGGQFAGIVRAEIESARADELSRALEGLASRGLRVTVQREDSAAPAATGTRATLDLVGQDQPGILRQITGTLASHGLNIEELSSERTDAPMGGGTLFQARATVRAPAAADLAAVRLDLEKIAADLMVELKLLPAA